MSPSRTHSTWLSPGQSRCVSSVTSPTARGEGLEHGAVADGLGLFSLALTTHARLDTWEQFLG